MAKTRQAQLDALFRELEALKPAMKLLHVESKELRDAIKELTQVTSADLREIAEGKEQFRQQLLRAVAASEEEGSGEKLSHQIEVIRLLHQSVRKATATTAEASIRIKAFIRFLGPPDDSPEQ